MRAVRPLVAAAVGASLVLGVSAHAATKVKPVCNLVTDPAGDGNGIDLGSTPSAPPAPQVRLPAESGGPSIDSLDVLSADVAASKKNVTAVIRVKALKAMEPEAATGMTWALAFDVNATTFQLIAHTDPTGKTNFDAAHSAVGINSLYGPGSVTGTFDTAKNEIHITAPVDLLSAQEDFKVGTQFNHINVVTGPEIAIPQPSQLGGGALLEGPTYYSDSTADGKNYAVGTPSCVTPGK